jgi:ribonuclease VapC
MVIDTSAILAVLMDEPERAILTELIEDSDTRWMSTATFVETSIVIDARYGGAGLQDLDFLLERAEIELIAVDAVQARTARRAWSRFGKGRHPAALNFGDCFSYALATTHAQPLLCKGDDFPKTDVALVELPPDGKGVPRTGS